MCIFLGLRCGTPETHGLVTAKTLLDNLIQSFKGSATDKENIGCVDLNEVLVGVLAPTLGRYVGNGAFNNLEQSLLYALARNIASNGWIVRLACDFVDLIDIDNAPLSTGYIKIRRLYEAQENVFDILTDVARFCERGRISDTERHVQNLGQRLCQQSFPTTGRTNHQDIALA